MSEIVPAYMKRTNSLIDSVNQSKKLTFAADEFCTVPELTSKLRGLQKQL
jgi:hypothetical protein